MTSSRFYRPDPHRPLRKIFVVATEGQVTEPQYLRYFKENHKVNIRLLPRKSSSPLSVLEALKNHIERNPIDEDDEVWAVIDQDSWSMDQIREVLAWQNEDPRFRVAISDPKIEYWILCHHEDACGVRTSQECEERLRKYGHKGKHLDMSKLADKIPSAIKITKKRHKEKQQHNSDIAYTNFYELIESILSDMESSI